MTPEERIRDLRGQIAYHSDRYYNQDSPAITDYEFDQLMLELKKLEKEHPELVTPEGGRIGEADGRRARASQCSHAESSGCFFKGRGL